MTQANSIPAEDMFFTLFTIALVLFLVTGIAFVVLLGYFIKLRNILKELFKK